MSQQLRDVMTSAPVVLPRTASVLQAAEAMADADIGPVLVVDEDQGGRLYGLLTDRDIVVRAVVPRRKLESTSLADVCTREVAVLSPSDTAADAVRVMSEHAVRRVPVLDHGRPVGIVSLADLARHGDRAVATELPAALADISSAPSDDPPTETRPRVRAALDRDRDLKA